jgi:aminoglycoside phosphotransferase (APT) family kinase protein
MRLASWMDRLPLWYLAATIGLVTRMVERRRRRYVLLIEELTPGRTGDQIAGCSGEAAADILRSIAAAHALHWGSPELGKKFFLRSLDMNPRMMHVMHRRGSPKFAERYGEGMPPVLGEALRWLDQNGVELMRSFHASAPQTLQHCDLRLDNVFFLSPNGAQAGGRERVALFDWQLAGRGPGVFDVAYFLSGALPVELSPEESRELVRGYHEELLAAGIEGYDLDACLRDYHRALLLVLHRISTSDAVDMGEDRGVDLVQTWLERLLARLEGLDFARVL